MMLSRCVPQFILALYAVMLPSALLAAECATCPASNIRLSASSYRNMTGHWIAEASLIRRSSREGSDMRSNERPWHYDIDFIRQCSGDDETLITTFSVLVPPARVGSDYKFFPNVGFYKLHTEKVNWEDARRKCAREGAHLAIVNSEAEENAIREVMRDYSKDVFAALIGFHDRFREGHHVTVFGDPLNSTGRVNWGFGQPDNLIYPGAPEGEDCGEMWSDGTIKDATCIVKLPFVCEQSL